MKGEAMSIILKGIDMPEDGEAIVLKIKGSKIYREYPTRYKFQPTRYKDAKAIQIPKDHGRLIDGDKLVKHLRKDPLFDLVERYGISGVIESRPTILDKERE